MITPGSHIAAMFAICPQRMRAPANFALVL